MLPPRPNLVRGSALLGVVSAALLLCTPASAQEVSDMLPAEVDGFTLQDVNAQEAGTVRAIYQPRQAGPPMLVMVVHGPTVERRMGQLLGRIEEVGEMHGVVIQGTPFAVLVDGGELVVFGRIHGFLVAAGYELRGQEVDREAMQPAVVSFIESFGLDRLADWAPPEEVTVCDHLECFDDAVTRCAPAEASVRLGQMGPPVKYQTEGETGDAMCRISFQFLQPPMAHLEDSSLYFTVDPADEFEAIAQGVLEGCLGGDQQVIQAHDCEGELVGALR